jgi:hypothetical protein
MLHSATIEGPFRLVLVLSALVLLPTAAPAGDAPLRGFLDAHCMSCHDAATRKGGLDLEGLPDDFREPAAFASWVKVHDRLQAGEMPPKARKNRPEKAEADAILKGLEAGLVDAERSRRSGVGRAVFRRLNRSEYENTLRDLLSIPGLKVKELLPEDGRAFGYDKSAVGLELSYVQLSKYIEAADAALDAAIAPRAARPGLYRAHIPGGCEALARPASNGETVFLKDFRYDDSVTPIPRVRDKEAAKALAAKLPYPGTMGVFRAEDESFKPRFPFDVVHAGKYRIRMSVWSFSWDKGKVKPNPRTEAAELVAENRTLGYFDAPSLTPTVTELEVWLNPMTSQRDQIQFNAASLRPAQIYNRPGLAAEYVGTGIAVDWVEIEGPLLDRWPPPSHRRLFGDLPFVALASPLKPRGKGKDKDREPADDIHMPKRPSPEALLRPIRAKTKAYLTNLDSLPKSIEFSAVASEAPESDAARLLADFLPRVFRRPVGPDEVARYVEMVQARIADGDMFEVALRTAYQAALCSPDFLFLKETPGALDDWAMASRLSYFLWNSMPDDTLFALARQGRLHDAEVLRGQVERMLQDPKAERFIIDFTDHWLGLEDIDATTPDKSLYPEFRRILRDAMLAESRAFFRELLEQDLSVTNIVHSDFAMLNQRLAEHYHIPGVVGSAIRRVALPSESPRGGFLTQAAVLKVTANGSVTSPVQRGAWVRRKIVGRPPEPPPPNLPAIEPDVRGTTTVRELLAKHRSNASCAACHNAIDPPGFALESFDVIGGFRTRYRSLGEGDVPDPAQTYFGQKVKYTWGPKVDASGQTADGRTFTNIEGFKALLLADPPSLARNMVGQLVTYATGAPIGFADRAIAEEVLDRTAERRYGMRSLIHAIVQSSLFRTK